MTTREASCRESAQDKLDSKKQLLAGYTAKELQACLNYDRQKWLFESGIKPKKEIEKLKKGGTSRMQNSDPFTRTWKLLEAYLKYFFFQAIYETARSGQAFAP